MAVLAAHTTADRDGHDPRNRAVIHRHFGSASHLHAHTVRVRRWSRADGYACSHGNAAADADADGVPEAGDANADQHA